MQQQSKITGSFDASFGPAILEIFEVASLEKVKVYDSFYRKYDKYVSHELTKKNTFTQNFDDLHAKIWVDFSGSLTTGGGLIEKFFEHAMRSAPELPATMSGTEASKTFNVTFVEWVQASTQFTKKQSLWINGDHFEGDTIHDLYQKVFQFCGLALICNMCSFPTS